MFCMSQLRTINFYFKSNLELLNLFRRLRYDYSKHEKQRFIRYKYSQAKPSIFRSDKTRTANVLNCFKNDRSSKFIGEVIFKKYVV
jgi:hypothetical protein